MNNPIPTKEKDDARYQSAAYKDMLPGWTIIHDVRGGTLALREKEQAYLPQFPIEGKESYKTRLKIATFYNFYSKTEEAMCGLVFRKDPALGDDVPGEIGALWEDIDGQGSHGDVFAKEVLKRQFDGHVFIMTEFPAADPTITDKGKEKAAGRRPYLVMYRACEAVNWDVMKVGGELVCSQITFKEETVERVGDFKQETVCRYRTWRLEKNAVIDENTGETALRATWELQKEVKDPKTNEMVLVPDGKGVTSLSEIPIACAYGEKEGFYTSKPPLLDLALKNIEHYQDYSDYRKGKSIAGVAIPWIRNPKRDSEGKRQPFGWDILFEVEADGEVGFAEANGNALAAQRTALEDVKSEMASLGLAMLVKKETPVTATERIIDAAQESSQLATIARSLEDALELSLGYMAEYMGLDSGGSLSLQLDDGRLALDPQMVTALLSAKDGGNLSLETLLTIFVEGDLLPEGVTVADELARIRSVDVVPIQGQ